MKLRHKIITGVALAGLATVVAFGLYGSNTIRSIEVQVNPSVLQCDFIDFNPEYAQGKVVGKNLFGERIPIDNNAVDYTVLGANAQITPNTNNFDLAYYDFPIDSFHVIARYNGLEDITRVDTRLNPAWGYNVDEQRKVPLPVERRTRYLRWL